MAERLDRTKGGDGQERAFRLLVEAYLDGSLTPAGVAEMERMLSGDAALRRVFVEVCLQDQVACRLFSAEQEVDPSLMVAVSDGEAAGDEDQSVMASLVEDALRARRLHEVESRAAEALYRSGEKERQFAQRRAEAMRLTASSKPLPVPAWAVWGSVAALVFVSAWGLALLSRGPAQPATPTGGGAIVEQTPGPSRGAGATDNVAYVRDMVQARWDASNPRRYYFKAGMSVTLESGLAEVVFGDGTVVWVEGPATFEPTGPSGMRLASGRLTARVPDGVTGFRVATAGGLVTDHGTEFGVFVGADGQTVAQTFEGRVTLAPPDGSGGWRMDAELDLRAGDAGVSSLSGGARPTAADDLAFVREQEFDARRNADDSPYARWLAQSYELRRDPDVVAYFVFDAADEAGGELTSRAGGGTGSAGVVGRLGNGADIAPPRWVVGRFATARALRFGEVGDGRTYGVVVPDHDALDLDGAMTLALWVRADREAWLNGTLLSKRTVPAGRMNYQVAIMHGWPVGGQELQFGAGRDDASLAGFAYSYRSGRLSAGRWHQVVFTADGRNVRYYIDGEHVHTERQGLSPLVNDAALLVGTSASGGGQSFFNTPIPFRGDIGEVLIAKRAFTDAEVGALYANSRGDD